VSIPRIAKKRKRRPGPKDAVSGSTLVRTSTPRGRPETGYFITVLKLLPKSNPFSVYEIYK
jgi:hypothetical protein